ncbi:sodium:proton symporter [Burkholderia cenocepacia]|uniref:Sodium:proton symporter n=1 Tax=Burkholderia cenocepacia TaxID=95486 RepID=A0A3S9N5W1_9BURK|nr:sodium:proton symporter [Burkholderia cenocepacia]
MLLTGGEFGHGSTVWIDSELYFYTVLGEFQVLLEVRRDRAGSGVILRRPDAGLSVATVHPVCVSTFEY